MKEMAHFILIMSLVVMCFIGMRTAKTNKQSETFWFIMALIEMTHATIYMFKNFY